MRNALLKLCATTTLSLFEESQIKKRKRNVVDRVYERERERDGGRGREKKTRERERHRESSGWRNGKRVLIKRKKTDIDKGEDGAALQYQTAPLDQAVTCLLCNV